jgi:hypothetical protein
MENNHRLNDNLHAQLWFMPYHDVHILWLIGSYNLDTCILSGLVSVVHIFWLIGEYNLNTCILGGLVSSNSVACVRENKRLEGIENRSHKTLIRTTETKKNQILMVYKN